MNKEIFAMAAGIISLTIAFNLHGIKEFFFVVGSVLILGVLTKWE